MALPAVCKAGAHDPETCSCSRAVHTASQQKQVPQGCTHVFWYQSSIHSRRQSMLALLHNCRGTPGCTAVAVHAAAALVDAGTSALQHTMSRRPMWHP